MHEHVSRKKSGAQPQAATTQRSRRQDPPSRQTLRRSRHFSSATASTSFQLPWWSSTPGKRRSSPPHSSTHAPRQAPLSSFILGLRVSYADNQRGRWELLHGDNSVEGRRGDQAGGGPQYRAKRTDPHSNPCAQLERVKLVSGATARRRAVPSASNHLPDPWRGRLPQGYPAGLPHGRRATASGPKDGARMDPLRRLYANVRRRRLTGSTSLFETLAIGRGAECSIPLSSESGPRHRYPSAPLSRSVPIFPSWSLHCDVSREVGAV